MPQTNYDNVPWCITYTFMPDELENILLCGFGVDAALIAFTPLKNKGTSDLAIPRSNTGTHEGMGYLHHSATSLAARKDLHNSMLISSFLRMFQNTQIVIRFPKHMIRQKRKNDGANLTACNPFRSRCFKLLILLCRL